MTVKIVCSVFDSAARVFGQPFFVPATGAAIRSVRDEVNRVAADNALYQHPEDFELFSVGQFDDLEGVMHGIAKPVLIVRCKDLVDAKSPPESALRSVA